MLVSLLGGVSDGTDWMIMLIKIFLQEMVEAAQVHQDAVFLIGFSLSENGGYVFAVLQRGDDVILLHQCQFDE